MTTRIIALTILGLMLGFILLMASVTYFVREPLPIVGPNQTLLLHTAEISPQIRSSVAIDGRYRVDLTVQHDPAQSPEVVLRPTGGQPIALSASRATERALSASGQLTGPGRWELVVTEGSTRETLQFITRE